MAIKALQDPNAGMRQMHIYANGCSMTYGSELADDPRTKECYDDTYRWRQAWPGHLGSLIGATSVYNDAVPSGSNDRVLRTSISWVLDYLEHGARPEDLFVVVGWSSSHRREFYVEGTWRQMVPHHDYSLRGLNELVGTYRRFAWSPFESAIRKGTQIVALHDFLERRGVDHLFFDAIAPISDDRLAAEGGIDLHLASIGVKSYYGINSPDDQSMPAELKRRSDYTGGHPTEYGHELWAETLFAFLNESRRLNLKPQRTEPTLGGVTSTLSLDVKRDSSRTIARQAQEALFGFRRRIRQHLRRDPFIYD